MRALPCPHHRRLRTARLGNLVSDAGWLAWAGCGNSRGTVARAERSFERISTLCTRRSKRELHATQLSDKAARADMSSVDLGDGTERLTRSRGSGYERRVQRRRFIIVTIASLLAAPLSPTPASPRAGRSRRSRRSSNRATTSGIPRSRRRGRSSSSSACPTSAVRLSERRAHRAVDGEHRHEGPSDTDGRLHHPAAEGRPRVEHLQGREDAAHAAAHVGRHRHARGASSRLSRVARLRARCRWSSPRSSTP